MTNREWLSTLFFEDLIQLVAVPCKRCTYADEDCVEHDDMNCDEGCAKWLEQGVKNK